ncbi:ABC transporter ATP-binding protein [Pseudonocardia sp. DR1-2]|uniref:ABC transporter ATP-binding protein n=1 Tax=Pseudonocardia sp. DR1-2 TaxID=2951168 RepID=UPI0020445768|nr:ABC transporter ATP-binding protein [Pseudonocardia sp. DR1-2]MCM3850024.1 ABC transporter ATP-binding protein [Pseudonocardia sp. DR1-2]
MEVTVRGLVLDYGGAVAVRDLDLDVAAGESIVLLGQSGCGKTSTMRCIAGLEEPTHGTITIGDRTVFDAAAGSSVPAHRRNVGMVFQSYAVWPHRTVEENVLFPLRMAGVDRAAARVTARQVLASVGLDHLADRGASKLSGGQMQRVALARSIAMRPAVLLLDEPLSNLDARLRDDLRVELRRIQQEQNLTSIYVTHDQTEALALADRVAIMQRGRITQLSSPEELYSRPASVSIAQFLGVSNVYPVQEGGDGVVRLADYVALHTAHRGAVEDRSACVRPEAVVVAAGAAPGTPGVNELDGVLRARSYQGALTRMSVALPGGLLVDSVRPSASVAGIEPGASVRVTVDPDDVQVLPAEVDDARTSVEGWAA